MSERPGRFPGRRARGSASGRPIMVLLDVLGQRWTLRMLWELRDGPLPFRELQRRCEEVSPTLLSRRLKELTRLAIIHRDEAGYRLSAAGRELGEQLLGLDAWARKWARRLEQADSRPAE